ncbi:MAG: hypothetical protein IJF75_07080 [Clostridia bacterium]|nr:hypothetical protein [Clostridia bacterium]
MITIIYGKPRKGKTSYMTAQLNEIAFDRKRNHAMQLEIMQRNASGFNLTIPQYSVCTNYGAMFRKFGYTPRPTNIINPYRLGFVNDSVDTHFLPPYSAIGIMEGQRYFNSRAFKKFPDWVSRFYELHGHNYLDIFIDTQRPTLIDPNIRELANFIEIVDKQNLSNGGISWLIRYIDGEPERLAYMESGRKDTSTYTESVFTIDYNVFERYDSRESKPLFYDGNFESDFYFNYYEPSDGSITAFKDYAQKHGKEMPEKFYKKDG